ncbi:bifunctional DNA-formamidopyrimidine glycosylase/DNA-(apurinic or apyrimidinic site) lyase [Donghicola sp.]|jgi:formamidopyrimidine-DNA glycosylase|uniref:bifunctional DNA-formamidopyrimidine glycosylase/DNA-(apurinic or apyrimidinic site) lyase n=1 Tax=Donghicola sp. TaxID=1929294 RepID=UPI0025D6851F|nr:bifunctional DNA-formamidopyrimidine glycosylase/DNA-(apurinic or apyrimidinic site) lyase [Donghicola sp.]MCT4578538.1 bifunctional DNA-formamidopyrimidine glycosylase/DNA-(apurinic or apyrimidinic site) lyase [Donghicola sp.]
MPELPEVETVRRGLEPVMTDKIIEHAQVNRPDLRWPLPVNMSERLTGQRVVGLRRRSKYILCDLEGGETLLIHLGMSGRMLISGAQVGAFAHPHPAPEKHDHVVLNMVGGARITFNDARRFGAMDLARTSEVDSHKWLVGLGPEPLGNAFSEDHLMARLKGRKMPIKSALLDQKNVAGLGNIYVCETLYRAGIHPARQAGAISERRVRSMVPIIRQVLEEAIAAGGSSLRDFRQADGELGYFQHNFDVYGREGMTCKTQECQAEVRRIVQSGRSSFYCPTCQR